MLSCHACTGRWSISRVPRTPSVTCAYQPPNLKPKSFLPATLTTSQKILFPRHTPERPHLLPILDQQQQPLVKPLKMLVSGFLGSRMSLSFTHQQRAAVQSPSRQTTTCMAKKKGIVGLAPIAFAEHQLDTAQLLCRHLPSYCGSTRCAVYRDTGVHGSEG